MRVTQSESLAGPAGTSSARIGASHSTLPSDYGFRLYYYQRISPIEQLGQERKANPSCRIYPTWPDPALFEQTQLPPQE
jgi:hypothetical protein